MSLDTIFIISIFLYLPVVFGLRSYISSLPKNKQKNLDLSLKSLNSLWDKCLSIFSFFGSYYCLKYLYTYGYNCNFLNDKETLFWIELFCMSKIPELIDTVFIVLRSKPLVLLQYYHHLATLFLCYLGLNVYPKNLIIASSMNYTVHTVMYGYFALVSDGYHGLRRYGFLITIMQLAQMVIAVYILLTEDMKSCLDEEKDISYIYYYSLVMYSSYVFLFGLLLKNKLK